MTRRLFDLRGRLRDEKYWNLSGKPCEILEWRMPVHTDTWTRSGRNRQIAVKNRRPFFNGNVLQQDGLALSAP